MADKINKQNIAENSNDVSLKTPSDFQVQSNCQELESSTEFNGSTISACFSNILKKFTIKQADMMGSFAEVLTNNQTKNINKISSEIGKKLKTLNDSLIAYNAKSSTGVGIISINPNKTKTIGAATISVNPKSISRVNASVEDYSSSGSSSSSSSSSSISISSSITIKRKPLTQEREKGSMLLI